jgi:hypothetical protein
MDERIWKIRQPAGMIHVEMSHKDVFYLSRIVAELFDLPDGSLLRIERAACNVCELTHCGRRGGAIPHPPSGINQCEPIAGLYQQTVDDAGSPPKRRSLAVVPWKPECVHRPTIEMADDTHRTIHPRDMWSQVMLRRRILYL